jgi:gas vesicle protein
MNNFYKGMLTGLIVGATVSMVSSPLQGKQMRSLKKNMGKTIRTVGQVIDGMGFMD